MADKIATNTFDKGMNLDLNPLVAPNNVMSFCLNGTFLTFNGEDYTLQNDMGNAAIKNIYTDDEEYVKLSDGFIPIGSCLLGGVMYIASHNPITGEGEIGSFPSITNNKNSTNVEFEDFDLLYLIEKGPVILKLKYKLKLELIDIEFNYGDYIEISENGVDNIISWLISIGCVKYSFYAGNTKLEYIEGKYIYNDDITDNLYIKYEWVDPKEFILSWDTTSNGPYTIYVPYYKESENHYLKIRTDNTHLESHFGEIPLQAPSENLKFNIIYTIDDIEYKKEYEMNFMNETSLNSHITLEFRYLWNEDLDCLETMIWKLYDQSNPTKPIEYNYQRVDDLECNLLNGYFFHWKQNDIDVIRPCIRNSCYNNYFDGYSGKDFINLSFDPNYQLQYYIESTNINNLYDLDLRSIRDKLKDGLQPVNFKDNIQVAFRLSKTTKYNLQLIPEKYSLYINFKSDTISETIENKANLYTKGIPKSKTLSEAKLIKLFIENNFLDKVLNGMFILGAGCKESKKRLDNHSIDLVYIPLNIEEKEINGNLNTYMFPTEAEVTIEDGVAVEAEGNIRSYNSDSHGANLKIIGNVQRLWHSRVDEGKAVKYLDVKQEFDAFIMEYLQDKNYCILGGIPCFVLPADDLAEIYADEFAAAGKKEDWINKVLYENQYFENTSLHGLTKEGYPKDLITDEYDEVNTTAYIYYAGNINKKEGKNGKDSIIDDDKPYKRTKSGYVYIIKISDSEFCISEPITKTDIFQVGRHYISFEYAYNNLKDMFKDRYAPLTILNVKYLEYIPETVINISSIEHLNLNKKLSDFQITCKDGSKLENIESIRIKKHLLYPVNTEYNSILQEEINYFNKDTRFAEIQDYLISKFQDFENLIYPAKPDNDTMLDGESILIFHGVDENNNYIDLDLTTCYTEELIEGKGKKLKPDDLFEYDDNTESLIPKNITDSENNYWTYIKPGHYNTQFLYSGINRFEIPLNNES